MPSSITPAPVVRWQLEQKTRYTLGARNFVFERIVAGAPLHELLDVLTHTCEELMPGVLCSVMIYHVGSGTLRIGAAASLPESLRAELEGLRLVPGSGSCAAAAESRTCVIVEDIAQDARWELLRDAAINSGLRACWSAPVFSSTGELLGTFAMYRSEPVAPDPFELDFLETSAGIAAIAIERARKEEELQRYRDRLEELVAERTAQLERANLELRRALKDVKVLRGMLPICAWCKRVRDDQGYWAQIEKYIGQHTEAVFTHALCPHCAEEFAAGKTQRRKR